MKTLNFSTEWESEIGNCGPWIHKFRIIFGFQGLNWFKNDKVSGFSNFWLKSIIIYGFFFIFTFRRHFHAIITRFGESHPIRYLSWGM